MCGIIGYVGARNALPILIDGLTSLTYRGYDSAGVALPDSGTISVVKCAGKVANLKAKIGDRHIPGTSGIGHTRWATHGEPNDVNSHPHTDCTGAYAIIHNGIFENAESLRNRLRESGHVITSRTDSELFAHLIEENSEPDRSFEATVRAALGSVEGAFAVLVVSRDDPGKIIAAKRDTPPLVIGIGEGEMFLASDMATMVQFTNKVVILEDGEMAVVTPDNAAISEFRESPVVGRRLPAAQRVFAIDMPPGVAERGGYPHFMLKEIHEQPQAIRETLRERLLPDGRVQLENFRLSPNTIRSTRRILFLGCGTALHAGMVAQYYYEPILRLPVQVEVASEFRYRQPFVGPEDLVIAISQSGETADTVSAVRQVQAQGAQVIAITNVVGSALSQIANHVIITRAGPEIAVASTKAFTAQLVACHLLLQVLARYRPTDNAKLLQAVASGLQTLPQTIESMLVDTSRIEHLAQRLAAHQDAYFIGRNLDEPIAREGSLKLKEISYLHSEAFAAGELKHGTLALLEPGTPVIALATQHDVYEKTISNVQEVMARGAWVIGVVPDDDRELCAIANDTIVVPRVNDLLAPIPTVVALQLLAYACGVARGCDIDQPRNLAKSVTVE